MIRLNIFNYNLVNILINIFNCNTIFMSVGAFTFVTFT